MEERRPQADAETREDKTTWGPGRQAANHVAVGDGHFQSTPSQMALEQLLLCGLVQGRGQDAGISKQHSF